MNTADDFGRQLADGLRPVPFSTALIAFVITLVAAAGLMALGLMFFAEIMRRSP